MKTKKLSIPKEVCPICKSKVISLSNPCVSGCVMYCPECKEASPYGETSMKAMYKWEKQVRYDDEILHLHGYRNGK